MSESNNSILERIETVLKFASESMAQKQEWATRVKENWEKTIQHKTLDIKDS